MEKSESANRDLAQYAAQTMSECSDVMQRCPDLLPLFADMRLRLHGATAAKLLGLTNSSMLRRQLISRRLPPFLLLSDWCFVVQFVDRFATDDASLGRWAMHRGEYASVYYSFIERVTGMLWSDLRRRGAVWVRQRALQMWRAHIETGE